MAARSAQAGWRPARHGADLGQSVIGCAKTTSQNDPISRRPQSAEKGRRHAPGTGEMPRVPMRCCRREKPAKPQAFIISVAAG